MAQNQAKCTRVTISFGSFIIVLYTHMHIHTCIYMQKELQRHNDKGRAKSSLEKYIPLTYFKASKRVTQGFTVRGSWRPNRTAIYWPLLLWSSALCLSRSPGLLNRRPRGPALFWMMAFFTAFYHQLVSKTPLGVPRTPSAGCGFLYHMFSPMSLNPNCLTSCLDQVI